MQKKLSKELVHGFGHAVMTSVVGSFSLMEFFKNGGIIGGEPHTTLIAIEELAFIIRIKPESPNTPCGVLVANAANHLVRIGRVQ